MCVYLFSVSVQLDENCKAKVMVQIWPKIVKVRHEKKEEKKRALLFCCCFGTGKKYFLKRSFIYSRRMLDLYSCPPTVAVACYGCRYSKYEF